MEKHELLSRLRRVEIRARGLSQQIFAGEYHSAFKGRGMAFSEVRAYRYGDDIRNIDWNVTARLNEPYVKVFEEERELCVLLMVDVSGSRAFGSVELSKKNIMTEVAALLAFSAMGNNDKVGLLLFSDRVERFIPPRKGRSHVMRLIWELVGFEPTGRLTDVGGAMDYMARVTKRRATIFVLSDFLDPGERMPYRFADSLRHLASKHDVVGLQVYDGREAVLPNVGELRLRDTETGEVRWINTGSSSVRKRYAKQWAEHMEGLKSLFMRSGVDMASIDTESDYVPPLAQLFKRRGR